VSIKPGDRVRVAEQDLPPEQALVAALLRQALADRRAASPLVRQETRDWFRQGYHRDWLHLVGLPETTLDQALQALLLLLLLA
jgi:hypothetical protein